MAVARGVSEEEPVVKVAQETERQRKSAEDAARISFWKSGLSIEITEVMRRANS